LLSFEEIADRLDLAVYLDVPEDVRLERRIKRDIAERGREPDDVRRQFAETVAPMHDRFVEPFRHRAHRTVALHEDYGPVADELIERLFDPSALAS
jgi:uridine kinase